MDQQIDPRTRCCLKDVDTEEEWWVDLKSVPRVEELVRLYPKLFVVTSVLHEVWLPGMGTVRDHFVQVIVKEYSSWKRYQDAVRAGHGALETGNDYFSGTGR